MRTLQRWAVVLMLLATVQLVGLPWVGLFAASKAIQTYRNIRQQGVVAALKSVPKGKGNCGMCRKVRVAKAKADQKSPPVQTSLEWTPAVIPPCFTLSLVQQTAGDPVGHLVGWTARAHAPPLPPPRA